MFIARETTTFRRRSEERKGGACLRASVFRSSERRRKERLLRAINVRTPNGWKPLTLFVHFTNELSFVCG